MPKRSRLSRKSKIHKEGKLARIEHTLRGILSGENISKATFGSGVATMAVGVPAAAFNPLLGASLTFLGAYPTLYGLIGIRLRDVRKMNVLQREAHIKKKIKEYLHEQEKRAIKSQRTKALKKRK